MQMLTKICKKPESNLLFTYENTVIKGINLTPIEVEHLDERVLSLAQVDKLYHDLVNFVQKAWISCFFY